MTTAIANYQPSLVLTETIASQGIYPSRDSYNAGMTMGMLHTYGFNFGMNGAPLTLGQLLSISQNTALFSLLGTMYGGNGSTTFALPDLRSLTAVGDGLGPGLPPVLEGERTGAASTLLTQQQMPASLGGSAFPVDEDQPELGLKYLIRIQGTFPSPDGGGSLEAMGMVVKFAGNFAPGGYAECAGQLLSISQNTALFQLLGTTYGGDGQTTFALPDLRGRAVVGASSSHPLGEISGQETISITQANLPASMGGSGVPINNREPSLALNYIIALQGIFPSQNSAPDPTQPMLGEIIAFAGNFAPRGFALCQGQLLSISQNTALFALLGTTYGGDGRTTFALPDLRGRDVLGQGGSLALGSVVGSDGVTLTLDNIPDLTYVGTNAGATHYGGNGNDNISGLGGADTIIPHGGNDIVDGGAGVDSVVLSGLRSAYTIEPLSNGVRLTGPGGVDRLTGVERLVFDNIVVSKQASDFNGDFQSDLLWRHTDGTTYAWLMNNGQRAVDVGFGLISNRWHIQDTGDFDGDGNSDLLWRHDDGTTFAWLLQDGQRRVDVDLGPISTHWQVQGTGDFDGDGDSDIIWRHDDGTIFLWLMKSGGASFDGANLGVVPAQAHIQGVGDFDGDGDSDILWRNNDGTTSMWLMKNNGTGEDIVNLGAVPASWHIQGTGDFDGDGDSDILWRNDDGATLIWRMQGGQHVWIDDLGVISNRWQIQATGDVNGDGTSDIIWRHDDGTTYAWLMKADQRNADVNLGVISNAWTVQHHVFDTV
jgi:microcystin-dependent protein